MVVSILYHYDGTSKKIIKWWFHYDTTMTERVNSQTSYFNYKDFFSIVLLEMVDANNKFVIVDIGSYGKEGDSSIFLKSLKSLEYLYLL